MNSNGKKTGLRMAVVFAVAGATMAMAAGPSSSESVALDQVVMTKKDAPEQKGGHGGGRGDRGGSGESGGILSGGLFGGNLLGAIGDGNIGDGNIGDGNVTGGEDSVLGNYSDNVLGGGNLN